MARNLPSRLPSVAAVIIALAICFQVAAASFVTARSSTPLPLTSILKPPTCDGGHGVFMCLSGDCFYDDGGAFACCHDVSDCTATTSCVPFGKEARGRTCSKDDLGCVSCLDNKPSCYTITNPAMHQYAVFCAKASSTIFTTSFIYDTNPVTGATSTLVGGPTKAWSSTATKTSSSTAAKTSSSTADSTSTSTLASSTTHTTATKTTHVPPEAPGKHLIPTKESISGSVIGGITVGVVGGAALLTLGLFLVYKWYKDRQINRHTGRHTRGRGILPGPRRRRKKRSNGTNNQSGPTIELDSSYDGPAPTPTRIHSAQNTSTISTPPLLSPFNEAYTHSPSPQPTNTDLDAGSEDPSTTSIPRPHTPLSEASPSRSSQDNSSPPFTSTPTPISPIFPTSSTAGTSGGRPHGPSPTEENRRKSSQLLPTAGPYLTAEQAVGEGYWEAEREQLEADKAVQGNGEVQDVSEVNEMIEENETGTVVRRRGQKSE